MIQSQIQALRQNSQGWKRAILTWQRYKLAYEISKFSTYNRTNRHCIIDHHKNNQILSQKLTILPSNNHFKNKDRIGSPVTKSTQKIETTFNVISGLIRHSIALNLAVIRHRWHRISVHPSTFNQNKHNPDTISQSVTQKSNLLSANDHTIIERVFFFLFIFPLVLWRRNN